MSDRSVNSIHTSKSIVSPRQCLFVKIKLSGSFSVLHAVSSHLLKLLLHLRTISCSYQHYPSMLLLLHEDTIFRPPWLKIPSTAELDTRALKACSAGRNSLFSPTARMAGSHRRLHSTPCLDIWSAAVVCQFYLTWPDGWHVQFSKTRSFLDSFWHCTQSQSIDTCCQNIRKQYLPHGGKYLTLKYKYKYQVLHLW